MNVNDYDVPIPPGDMLETIFNHQYQLMIKYHEVESMNLCMPLPDPRRIDFDDKFCQLRLKEFAWRITEELAEATSCLDGAKVDEIHFLEELVDCLHFSIEFDIMSKITPEDLANGRDKLTTIFSRYLTTPLSISSTYHQNIIRQATWETVEKLGIAMNTLKNKPWKTTHMITDKEQFRTAALAFNRELFHLLALCGFDATSLTKCYLNKNAVNQFRIRSHY